MTTGSLLTDVVLIRTHRSYAHPGGVLSYRRKNCDGAIPNGNVPCELQWGVDNNRNYGNLWGGPLDTSQWISLVLFGLGALYWVRVRKSQPVATEVA